MGLDTRQVTVLIAAHNAELSLGRAIASALSQPQTAQVIVVDDASTDGTRAVALAETDRDARVVLIPFDTNRGPAAARNAGLDSATGTYVAILDSDDMFLPGRLGMLLSGEPGEMTADNIAFVDPTIADDILSRPRPDTAVTFDLLATADFVRGNLYQGGPSRGELGFLKPILHAPFLRRHGLRYDDRLRLAEDYDLYVRMLLAGARFRVTRTPGYAAVIRAGSLSAQHGADDLARLCDAIEDHLRLDNLTPEVAGAMRLHRDQVRARRDHRVFLNLRREKGPMAAIRYAIRAGRLGPIVRAIARDKLRMAPNAGDAVQSGGMRLLLPDAPEAR